jgi:hypothetical protein
LTARERNFDEFKSGGLHEKHAVATWNLGTISAFACRQRKTPESLLLSADIAIHTDRTENIVPLLLVQTLLR